MANATPEKSAWCRKMKDEIWCRKTAQCTIKMNFNSLQHIEILSSALKSMLCVAFQKVFLSWKNGNCRNADRRELRSRRNTRHAAEHTNGIATGFESCKGTQWGCTRECTQRLDTAPKPTTIDLGTESNNTVFVYGRNIRSWIVQIFLLHCGPRRRPIVICVDSEASYATVLTWRPIGTCTGAQQATVQSYDSNIRTFKQQQIPQNKSYICLVHRYRYRIVGER